MKYIASFNLHKNYNLEADKSFLILQMRKLRLKKNEGN